MKKMKLLTLIASVFMIFACSSRITLAQEVDKQDSQAVVGFYKTSDDNSNSNSSDQPDTSGKINDQPQEKTESPKIDQSSGKNLPKTGSQDERYLFIIGLAIVLSMLIIFLKKRKEDEQK